MGIESNNPASISGTAIYKLLLAHIGQTVMITTAAATVVDGVLEGVQQSYATVRRPNGDAEFVALAYIVSVSFPGA